MENITKKLDTARRMVFDALKSLKVPLVEVHYQANNGNVRFHMINDVMEVQADGAELVYVKEELGVRPGYKLKSASFFGDEAKFIAANIGGK